MYLYVDFAPLRTPGGFKSGIATSCNGVLEAARTARIGIYVQFWRFKILHSVLLRTDRVIESPEAGHKRPVRSELGVRLGRPFLAASGHSTDHAPSPRPEPPKPMRPYTNRAIFSRSPSASATITFSPGSCVATASRSVSAISPTCVPGMAGHYVGGSPSAGTGTYTPKTFRMASVNPSRPRPVSPVDRFKSGISS